MKQRKSLIVLVTELAGDGTSKCYYSADTPEEISKYFADALDDMAHENYELYAYLFSCECPTELLMDDVDTQDDDEDIDEELECTGECESGRYGWYVIEYVPEKHDELEPENFDDC
jgi:hypothetical protein